MDFYILSLKHPPVGNCALFWGPNDCGYVCELGKAGIYSQEQIDEHPDYYNNGGSTLAIPCDAVERNAVQHVRWDALARWRRHSSSKPNGGK